MARRNEGLTLYGQALFGLPEASPELPGGLWCVTPALSRLQSARLWTTWRAGATVLAQRKPTLLLRFIGEFLLRLGARALVGSLLFHEAPRKERCPESTVTALAQTSSDLGPRQSGER